MDAGGEAEDGDLVCCASFFAGMHPRLELTSIVRRSTSSQLSSSSSRLQFSRFLCVGSSSSSTQELTPP